MRFPLTLESSATPRRVQEAFAMSPEFQAQANSRDQDERPAITGVSREVAVAVDVSQAQTPGKILSVTGSRAISRVKPRPFRQGILR